MTASGRLLTLLSTALALASCAGDRLHRDGMNQLAESKVEAGLDSLERASRTEPDNAQFRSDFLSRRSEQVNRLLASADSERAGGKAEAAQALYQRVAVIEPANSRAQAGMEALARQRLHAPLLEQAGESCKKGEFERCAALLKPVLADDPRNAEALALQRLLEEARVKSQLETPVLFASMKKPISLEFRDAPLKIVLEALARSSGVDFILDKDVRPDLRTTVFLRQTPLEDAIELILQTSRLDKKVLNGNAILIYANTPEKQKEYQELVVKGFYLANADVKQTQAMIKSMLKTKDTFIDEKLNMLMIRDTPEAIRLAEKMIAMQDLAEPEVMLDVEVLEVKRARLLDLGIEWPSQLTLAPLVATPTTLSSLRGLNSGNIGITTPTATLNARSTVGDANILANPRIRARNHEKAKIMIGDKVPFTNNVTTATGVINESVQYLDVGIKLEVEPSIYLQDDVAIKIGLEVSSLVREVRTPTGALAYQIGSRSASTVLRLKDGETQVLAGLISDEDRSDASRVPGIGSLPILNRLFGTQKDDRQKTEIVLSITPHLIRNISRPDAAAGEFWSGTETALRTRPLTLAAPKAPEGADKKTAEAAGAPAANAPTAIGLTWQGPAQVKVGEQFKVAVRMKADGGVRSLPFQLGFDPAVLQVLEVAEGPYFKKNEARTSMSSNIDAAAGRVFVSVVRAGVDGAGGEDDVAVLTIRALAPGKTELKMLSTAPLSVGDKVITPVLPAPFAVTVAN